MFVRSGLGIALCIVLTLAAQQTAAHRLKLTTSEIVWQAEGSALEVTHALHLDDALALLARLDSTTGSLDPVTSARLMNYLNRHFQVVTASATLTLEPYGAHIDGGVLYMYQRASVDSLPQALEVTNTILHDVVEGAQNQVNWRVGEIVRSHSSGPDEPITWLALAEKNNSVNHSDQSLSPERREH